MAGCSLLLFGYRVHARLHVVRISITQIWLTAVLSTRLLPICPSPAGAIQFRCQRGGQRRTLTKLAAPPLPSYVYNLLARCSSGRAIRFRSSPALPQRAATSLSSERPVVRKGWPQAGTSYTAEEVPSKDAVCLWGVQDRQVVGLVQCSLGGARSGSGRVSSFTKRREREGGEYTRREGRVTCRLSLIQVPPGPAPAPPSCGQCSFPHTLPSFRSSSTTA